jgi:ribosome recycling factor
VNQSSKGELVVKSVTTAVVATAIVEAGLGISKNIAKQPVILFGLGLVAGYFTYKYRKEIVAITSHTAEQGKDFVIQQKNNLSDMLAEIQGSNEETDQDA